MYISKLISNGGPLYYFVQRMLVLLVALSMFGGLGDSPLDGIEPVQASDRYQYVSHVVRFDSADLVKGSYRGYDMIRLPGGFYPSAPGEPMLPAIEIKLALPAGMEARAVRIIDAELEELEGRYTIFPAQPARAIGVDDTNVPFVEPEKRIYESADPFPGQPVNFVSMTDLSGQGMAVIQIWPLKYEPLEGKLYLYKNITFAVEGSGGYECGDYLSFSASGKTVAESRRMVSSLVANPEDVSLQRGTSPLATKDLPANGPYDHVIITDASFVTKYQPLADWHTRRGLRDTIVTTSWIYSNYSGQNHEKVRSFIIDAETSWETKYILIGGDADVVPFVDTTLMTGLTLRSVYSDMYYSDWDDDWTCELYVGRVSAENQYDWIENALGKILLYERTPPVSNYPLDICLVGMDLKISPPDSITLGEDLMDSIHLAYIQPGFDVTTIYDSDITDHEADFKNALNDGQGLVNHCDHTSSLTMGIGDENHGGANLSVQEIWNLHNDGKPSVSLWI